MTGDTLQTEFEFSLPNGFVSDDGTLHREGTMRLATAADEILPLKDPRVRSNESYLTVILLSRVVTRLGSLPDVTPQTVENLFVADLAYLQDMYERVNDRGMDAVDATCPDCGESFTVEVGGASGVRETGEPPTQTTGTDGGSIQTTETDGGSIQTTETDGGSIQTTETDGGIDHSSDAQTGVPPGDDGASATADAVESPPASGRGEREAHGRQNGGDDQLGCESGNRYSPTAGSSGADRPAGTAEEAGRSSISSGTTRRDDRTT